MVPQAVVFHAEAAHRGVRRTPITGRHTHYQERRAALYTLLVNAPARWLPFQVLRLGLGTLIRMIGYLLVRQVGQSLDELAALVSLYSSPRELLRARRSRARRRPAEPHDVRHLLAPRWLPYRHGLDFVSDLAAALTMQASDVAERRRAAKLADAGTPVRRADSDDDEDDLGEDTGFVVRFLTNPVAVLLTLFVIVALFGARDAFGTVSGGSLSPAPGEVGDWWQLHLDSWHAIGQGTPVPAPAYILPLAVVASVLGGSPAAAVSALLVLAVPISLWGAWRLPARGRAPGRRRRIPDLAGRLGCRELRAAPRRQRSLGRGAPRGRGHRGPAALARPRRARLRRPRGRPPLARGLALGIASRARCRLRPDGVLGRGRAGRGRGRRRLPDQPPGMRDRSVWGPPAAALASVPVLLSPWWLPALLHGAGAGLFFDAGRLPMPVVGFEQLLLGRIGDGGAPWWLGLVLPALAALALIPRATRIPVLVCWMVALGDRRARGGARPGRLRLPPPSRPDPVSASWSSFSRPSSWSPQSSAMHGFLRAIPAAARWRRPAVATCGVLSSLVPAFGLGWFVVDGHGELGDEADTGIPAYMVQNAMLGPAHGILVIRGDVPDGLD